MPEPRLYPQPFGSNLHIELPVNAAATLALYDCLSRKVMHSSFTGSTTLFTEALPKGLYFYKVYGLAGVLGSGKIVKQ